LLFSDFFSFSTFNIIYEQEERSTFD
jgi:hypothetical protein